MTNNQLELGKNIHNEVRIFTAEGDTFAETANYDEALNKYNSAWELTPEPKTEREASTWILVAIADIAFKAKYFTSAREALDHAMACPGAIGNPFIHLRRGQVLFEQGEKNDALQELLRAYMGGGIEMFSEDDQKHLLFLKSKIEL